jgi:hypothetical protein
VASGAATPATKTIGSTGKMQGEIPAIRPAANATKISITRYTVKMDQSTIAIDPLVEL